METKQVKNIKVLSVIANLIISNNSIHNYQIRYIDRYMDDYNIIENYSIIDDIFYKRESGVSSKKSIEYFKDESIEVQKDLLNHLIIIAKLDGVLDRYEREFLSALYPSYEKIEPKLDQKFKEMINLFQEEDKEKRDELDLERIKLEQIVDYINRIRKVFNDSNLYSKEYAEIKDDLLDYSKLRKISNEDFKFIEPISNEILTKSKKLYNSLSKNFSDIKLKSGIDEEIIDELDKSLNIFSKKIINKIEDMDRELSRKENTLNNFTISLIGKTKVGKSTLHTVLTGEGGEGIGEGKQGTTKYNRIYQWGGLRIVDTPGIESSKEGGKTDEEVAMEIITESDIICIVLTDDQIGKALFDLIDKIVTRNKSVIILLNHKRNMKHPVRYKEFIENSKSWITDKGNKGIQGHFKRLDKFIASKGYEDKVKRYPVLLVAALLAMEDNYKEDKINLIEGSNMDAFKSGLRNEIKENGIKIKSQTILDDSAKILKDVQEDLKNVERDLNKIMEKMIKSKDAAFIKIKKEQKNLMSNINSVITRTFKDLELNHAYEFAAENYDSKNINKKWNQFINERKFNENLNRNIELELINFSKNIKDIIDDMHEDMQVGLDMSINISSIDLKFINIDFKKIFRRLSGLGAIVASIAAAFKIISGSLSPIIIGVTSIVGWLSSKFKSKEERKAEAIEKLEKNTIDGINKSKKEAIDKVNLELNKTINENISKFKNLLEIQEKQFKENKDSISRIIYIYDLSIESIEERYNERLKYNIN